MDDPLSVLMNSEHTFSSFQSFHVQPLSESLNLAALNNSSESISKLMHNHLRDIVAAGAGDIPIAHAVLGDEDVVA